MERISKKITILLVIMLILVFVSGCTETSGITTTSLPQSKVTTSTTIDEPDGLDQALNELDQLEK